MAPILSWLQYVKEWVTNQIPHKIMDMITWAPETLFTDMV